MSGHIYVYDFPGERCNDAPVHNTYIPQTMGLSQPESTTVAGSEGLRPLALSFVCSMSLFSDPCSIFLQRLAVVCLSQAVLARGKILGGTHPRAAFSSYKP